MARPRIQPIPRHSLPTPHGTTSRVVPGSVLLESVLASAIALTTLAVIAPMFAQQLEQTRRARDTNLLEAAVNKDSNAIKQYARYWSLKSGSYTDTGFLQNTTGASGGYVTSPTSMVKYLTAKNTNYCTKQRTFYFNAFHTDLLSRFTSAKNPDFFIKSPPGSLLLSIIPRDITPEPLIGRYRLNRYSEINPATSTLGLRYELVAQNNNQPLPFARRVQVQLEHTLDGC